MDNIDLEILEAAYYDEPWHILCAMVEKHFEDMRDLVPRILRLRDEGLLEIIKDQGTEYDPSVSDLEKIALTYELYGTDRWPESPTWSMKTTDTGFKHIKDRFE